MKDAAIEFIKNSLLIIGIMVVGTVWMIILEIAPFQTAEKVCIEAQAKGYVLEQCKEKP